MQSLEGVASTGMDTGMMNRQGALPTEHCMLYRTLHSLQSTARFTESAAALRARGTLCNEATRAGAPSKAPPFGV